MLGLCAASCRIYSSPFLLSSCHSLSSEDKVYSVFTSFHGPPACASWLYAEGHGLQLRTQRKNRGAFGAQSLQSKGTPFCTSPPCPWSMSLTDDSTAAVRSSPSSSTLTAAVPLKSALSASPGGLGTFRAGQKRAEVKVPSLLLTLSCDEAGRALEGETQPLLAALDSAVAGGATLVLLRNAGNGEGQGAGQLFEVACSLKALLRGRAQLLVADRADIAAAAGADGVLLSDQGLPAVVARRMMEGAAPPDAPFLPLVARAVTSAQAGADAAAAEGVDLLLVLREEDSLSKRGALELEQLVSIPIVYELAKVPDRGPDGSYKRDLSDLPKGAAGVGVSLQEMKEEADRGVLRGDIKTYCEGVLRDLRAKAQRDSGVSEVETEAAGGRREPTSDVLTHKPASRRRVLEQAASGLVQEERRLLSDILAVLREGTPEMAEITLLEDALARLDDLFLVVIVGEFNSGKSSVVNALLGGRFLKTGVVPTTNEITMLRHVDDVGPDGMMGRHPDGHFVRFLPAQLLKQMNLVDTPGTNVILERQQRLTEEFVPRADLVLFVLSADRALTESEVSFLRYIREWGKKVVFVVNKLDVLEEQGQVAEVVQFVEANAQRLLGVDRVQCLPVSARSALKAKMAAIEDADEATDGSAVLDPAVLAQDAVWRASGFEELERFIFGFLEGSTDAGAERLRLKLATPLGVASALLAAGQRQLAAEAQEAARQRRLLESLEEEVEERGKRLRQEMVPRIQQIKDMVDGACTRAEQLVDSTLRLANVGLIGRYLLTPDVSQADLPGGQRFQSQVVGPTAAELRNALYNHRAWLQSSCAQQAQSHMDFVRSRWPQFTAEAGPPDTSQAWPRLERDESDEEDWSSSVDVLDGFSLEAAALLLDEELRQEVVGMFTGVGAAGVSATILTSVLPTTVEDLLALALCTVGGYAGALRLPERRAEVKKKVRKAAVGLSNRLSEAMQSEMEAKLDGIRRKLDVALDPCRESVLEETQRVADLQRRAENLGQELQGLQQHVQNLGL
eukprot:TRINITY_DN15057_c0_g1_i1.p1 TRINITY_DN15057_c0_g1~~TRINITY_DN15057_c0_g1_i1.p1  ORF type:complete len:1020 (+),score=205.09 TRINITY_DN15057_c0_g1_i1:210-3269(+)